MLVGILQMEEDGRLSCRWLGPLKDIDPEFISECDRQFDRAKAKSKFRSNKKTEPVKGKHMKVSLDATQCNLSHILKMKELFRRNVGPDSVEIHFVWKNRPFATLKIEEPWGVKATPDLKAQLQKIAPVIADV